MTGTVLQTGMYVRIAGEEYRVVSKGGWALWSARPAPGFTKSGGNGYIRPVRQGEQLESYRVEHRGAYRGIPISVYPSTGGRVMATSRDDRARNAGFDPFERDEWVKLIPLDDPELRFTTTRSPEPGPWMNETGSRRRS